MTAADPTRHPSSALRGGRWRDVVATITLDRPERKNPLTFESYAELRDTFSGSNR